MRKSSGAEVGIEYLSATASSGASSLRSRSIFSRKASPAVAKTQETRATRAFSQAARTCSSPASFVAP